MEPGQQWIFLLVIAVGGVVSLIGFAVSIGWAKMTAWIQRKCIDSKPEDKK